MTHPVAAHGPVRFPDAGFSPSQGADRRGERVVINRRRAPGLSSYLATAMIAAGLVAAWASICCI